MKAIALLLLVLILAAVKPAWAEESAVVPAPPLDLSLPRDEVIAPVAPNPVPVAGPARRGWQARPVDELPYGAGYEARQRMGQGAGIGGWQGGGRGRRGSR